MRKSSTILYLLLVFLLSGLQDTFAQAPNPPVSLMPAPAHQQAKVKVFYSSHYSSSTTMLGITSNSAATRREVTTVLGKELIFIEGGLNSWEHISFSNALDINDYDSISFDVYVVKSPFDLKVQLGAGSSAIVITPKLQEGWNRVRIKLANFKYLTTPPDLTNVGQVSLINNGGYSRTVYLDNIYAFGSESDSPLDPELPAQMAPIPTREAADVKAIFSDAYTSISPIKSFSGTGLAKMLPVTEQENILKIENGLNNWANMHFDVIGFEDKDSLHIDIYVVRTSGSIELKFRFDDAIGVEQVRTLNPGWNYLDFKLADFKGGSSLKAISMFKILRIGGYPQNVFIDNLYAYGVAEDDEVPVDPENPEVPVDPTAPTVAAPKPIHPQEDVRSIFSNHYDNVATISQFNPGLPVSEMKYIKALDGDDMIKFTGMNWSLLKIDPAFNMEDMDYLHIDIYTEGTPRLVFGVSDGFNESRIPEQYLAPGWKSFDFPISLFRDSIVDLTKINIIRMFSASGFAISRMYFDNIYAFKGDPSGNPPTFEIKSAPEPIMSSKTVKSFYTDKYTNQTVLEVGELGQTTKFRFQKITDTDLMLRMRSLDRMTLRALTPVNISDMVAIHMNIYKDVYGGDATLEVGFRSVNSEQVVYAAIRPELKNDEWTYVNIPIADLVAGGLDVTAVQFVEFKGSGNIYVDNLFAFKGNYTEGLGEEPRITMNWTEASKADELPDRNQAFMGVNLGNASGGEVPGVLNQNYTYPTFDDLYYFKSKGVRLIRFPFKWERVQHELNGPLDLELDLQKMKEIIAEAERIGMYIMPDMHNYCRRKVNGTTHKFGVSNDFTKEHFADVWKKLAEEFSEFDNIWGYDLMNEPYSLSPGVWFDAAQAAINAIRTVDMSTPIVVEGESYAAASSWPTTGGKLINLVDPANNLIFQAHTYFDRDKSGTYKLGSFDQEVLNAAEPINRIKPFVDWLKANKVRGILGEFGVPRDDVRWLDLLDEVLYYLKDNGVSGTYWVAGANSSRDQLSVQPLETFTMERAQMRVLEKYFGTYASIGTGIFTPKAFISKQAVVYPNPVTNLLRVHSELTIKAIEVYTIAGQMLKSVKGETTSFEVGVDDLINGSYLVKVYFGDGSAEVIKMVKM